MAGQPNNYFKITNNSSAGALLFAIITAFVLSLVASTFVLLSSSQYKVVDNEVDRIIKYYRAQAGMEWAIYQAYTNPTTILPADLLWHPITPPVGLAVTIDIRRLNPPNPAPYEIRVSTT